MIGFAAATLSLCVAAADADRSSDAFDKPVSKQVIPLPADPDNPQAKAKRSCFNYPGFTVKEVDLGEVGADTLAIIPISTGKKEPLCEQKTGSEFVIKRDDWSGYFAGTKGNFVFFDADDGLQGGMPFAVFSGKTGKKLFEDSRLGDNFTSIASSGDGLVLRYKRVYLAPCPLFADSKACWKKITAATALADATPPDCSEAYEKEMKRTPKFAQAVRRGNTVIGYNVEARYAGGKPTFAPLPGRTTCWLED